jgi:hypothetical protein
MGDRSLTPKIKAKAFLNFFEMTKIPSVTGYLYDPNGPIREHKDWDYSHVIFFDDTPANLKTAKKWFNMQTVLVATDRVHITDDDLTYIDAVTDDIAGFKNNIVMALRNDRQNRGQPVPPARLTVAG